VPHALHQLPEAGALSGRNRVPGVAEAVKVQFGQGRMASSSSGPRAGGCAARTSGSTGTMPGTWSACDFGRLQPAVRVQFCQGGAHPHFANIKVQVPPAQGREFAKAEVGERRQEHQRPATLVSWPGCLLPAAPGARLPRIRRYHAWPLRPARSPRQPLAAPTAPQADPGQALRCRVVTQSQPTCPVSTPSKTQARQPATRCGSGLPGRATVRRQGRH